MPPEILKPGPFSLLPYSTSAGSGPAARFLLGLVETVSGLRTLQRKYDSLPPCDDAGSFIERSLESLRISYHAAPDQIAHIPRDGPAVVVANHPFGGVDGMIMAHLLGSVRPDVRILANFHLDRIPALRDMFFTVDPFNGRESWRRNLKPLRESIRWLRSGGLLMVFPAGEVSHFQFRRRGVSDPQWLDTVGRIVRHTKAPVLPVCFHGRNSALFSLAGMLHPGIRTLLLPRELVAKSNANIRLSIGKPIGFRKLSCLETARELTDYLRLRCYLLESGEPLGPGAPRQTGHKASGIASRITAPVSREWLREEIAGLPPACLLHRTAEFDVLVSKPGNIPRAMQEIGRLREEAFRAVGEGTGRAADIDLFDTWYDHLFLWHRERGEIAGAYRLGPVDEILQQRGKKGLYTHSLFKYRRSLLEGLGPTLELGRSFVTRDYQRSFQALNLLWKGIGLYVAQRRLAVLFGPVSVSRDYSTPSRRIIVDSLHLGAFSSPLARQVRPRHPVRRPLGRKGNRSELRLIRDVDLVSDMISQIEEDGKGIPVLMRQYLKIGGRFLGFSQDPDFADVIDGLVVVDLRCCDERVLDRFMGRETARDYLAAFGVPGQETG